MFLQDYLYQASKTLWLAINEPEKLHASDDKSTAINPVAIKYGTMEFRAACRRYLHFALPCLAADLWARGLKKRDPTAEQAMAKISQEAQHISTLCYRSRKGKLGSYEADDVIAENYLDTPLTSDDLGPLSFHLQNLKLGPLAGRKVPFYDDGHTYNFFYDNTPLDASRNLLLSEVEAQVKADPSRSVALPNVLELFAHDEYFVMNQFKSQPNGCLGVGTDGFILNILKLLMGPECVLDIGDITIKEMQEQGLWHQTEFEKLLMTDGQQLVGSIKAALGFTVTAPQALYWDWIKKSGAYDAPLNTKQWVRKELSDNIEAGDIYHMMLDNCTIKWLTESGIAEVVEDGPDEVFRFPTYDRNRYATRREELRGMSFQEWAWADENVVKFNKSLGVKLVGKAHPKYVPMEDLSSMSAEEAKVIADAEATDASYIGQALTRKGREILSEKAKQFLDWSQHTIADVGEIIDVARGEKEVVDGKIVPTAKKGETKGSVGSMSLGEDAKDKQADAPKSETKSTGTTATSTSKPADTKVSRMDLS